MVPGKVSGYKPRAIAGEHRLFLLGRKQAGDFTLRGFVAGLAERGLKVDYRTLWNFVHKEKLSFKKNRTHQRTGSSRRRAKKGSTDKVLLQDRA